MSGRSIAGSVRARPPRGARPPAPDRLLWYVRATLMIAIALWLALLFLPTISGDHLLELQQRGLVKEACLTPSSRSLHLSLLSSRQLLGGRVSTCLRAAVPRVARLIHIAGIGSLGTLVLEVACTGCLIRYQTAVMRHSAGVALCIRTSPPAPGTAPRGNVGSGEDLWRALHQLLPAPVAWSGHAPWLALTLVGRPEEPAELGAWIGVADVRARAQCVAAVRKLVEGHAPGASVDEVPDDLRAMAAPGTLIAWRDLGLRYDPAYPLRSPADMTADLLGPLLAALRPRPGVLRTELQMIVRPDRATALDRGWRGRALRLLLRLRRQDDYALAPDLRAIEAKLAGAPFQVTLRLLALAATREELPAAEAELDETSRVLGQYAARTAQHLQRLRTIAEGCCTEDEHTGRFRTILSRAPRPAPPETRLLPYPIWRPAEVLASNELAGLWHLPMPALGHLVRWLPCRHLPAPPHAFTANGTGRIVVGHARRSDGRLAPVGPALRDLRQVLHLTAGMGAGKSRFLATFCRQVIPTGFTLIDGKGDDRAGSLVASVRELIPLDHEQRLLLLDILDADWPIGLNPLAQQQAGRPGNADLVLGQVLATFARIDPATWGRAVGMQQYLQMATMLVLESEAAPTLATVKQALVDALYRERLLQRARNPEVRTFWETTYPQLGETQKGSRDALLRRFDLLLTAETTRYLVTQAAPPLDLHQAIDNGMIVLIPLPDLTLGGMAGAIGTLIFQAFVRAAFDRRGSDQTRRDYPLIVDEFQVLLGMGDAADVETAVSRLRALGIPALYAHQALAQLGDLEALMRVNAQNRLLLQTQEPDASAYARQFAAHGITAGDISRQDPNEHQYAALVCDGRPTGLFSLCPLPWPEPVQVSVSAYSGPNWQTVLPAASPDPAYDRQVLRLVYGSAAEPATLGQRLATTLSEREWQRLHERWDAIRATQRAHILRHPGCIPDRMQRQQWLSRLLIARPRILAEVEYRRQRPAIVGSGEGTRVFYPPDRAWHRKAEKAITEHTADAETWATQVTGSEAVVAEADSTRSAEPNRDLFLR